MMDNEIYGLPRNIKKFVLDAKTITFDNDNYNDNNNISPFPVSLEKLTICGKGLTLADVPIFSSKNKKAYITII